jgi:hypothetical protein
MGSWLARRRIRVVVGSKQQRREAVVDGSEASVLVTRWPLVSNEVTQLSRSSPSESEENDVRHLPITRQATNDLLKPDAPVHSQAREAVGAREQLELARRSWCDERADRADVEVSKRCSRAAPHQEAAVRNEDRATRHQN